jgi:hypothetical protein
MAARRSGGSLGWGFRVGGGFREKPEKLGPLPSPEAVAMACGRFLIAGRLERTAGDTAC